jgi:hypothetical protein
MVMKATFLLQTVVLPARASRACAQPGQMVVSFGRVFAAKVLCPCQDCDALETVENARPQHAQNRAYGLVMRVLQTGQALSMGVPSLMQNCSLDVPGIARKQRGHKQKNKAVPSSVSSDEHSTNPSLHSLVTLRWDRSDAGQVLAGLCRY